MATTSVVSSGLASIAPELKPFYLGTGTAGTGTVGQPGYVAPSADYTPGLLGKGQEIFKQTYEQQIQPGLTASGLGGAGRVEGLSEMERNLGTSLQNMQAPTQFGAGTGLATQAGQGQLGTTGQAAGYGQMGAGFGASGVGMGQQAAGLAGVGLGLGGQAAGAGQNYMQMATDPRATQAFMSPYMQNVVDYQKSQAYRDYQMGQPKMQAAAVGQGAFGGNRLALQQSEAQRGLMSQMQGIEATGAQNAFQNAQQQQQFGANLGLQGYGTALQGLGQANTAAGTLGQLGTQQLGADTNIINLQSQAGAQQQAQEQQKINQSIQDYATAQQYPYMQLGIMNSMLRGLPLQSSTTSMYQAQPSTGQQLLGYGLGALGAYKAFG